MNHISMQSHSHCTGCILANTRPYQGDWEIGSAIRLRLAGLTIAYVQEVDIYPVLQFAVVSEIRG